MLSHLDNSLGDNVLELLHIWWVISLCVQIISSVSVSGRDAFGVIGSCLNCLCEYLVSLFDCICLNRLGFGDTFVLCLPQGLDGCRRMQEWSSLALMSDAQIVYSYFA